MRLSDPQIDVSSAFGGSKGPALRWIGCPPPTPGAGAAGRPRRSKTGRNELTVPVRVPVVEERLVDRFPHSPKVSNMIAAQILGLTPQCLRRWASYQTGPFEPTRGAGGRLMWSVADLQNYLDGKAALPSR